MSLPALVVFSISDSNNNEVRYLSFTGPQRQLRFGPVEGVFSDTARFAVESAGDGLVHIRSCYDNYYWARASRNEPWLVASSREKVEDMTKDECTLFRPRLSTGNVFVEFVHAQSGLNVMMRPANDAHAYNLCVEHGAPTEFSYADFAVLIRTRLPRYVTFLGDNNKFLSARNVGENAGFLHFSQYDVPSNREVGFEVFYSKSGDNVRVKSMSINDFWCTIVPDPRVLISPLPEFDRRTFFDVGPSSPPNTPEPGIAFRSLPSNQYCNRSPTNNLEFVVNSTSAHNRNTWLRPMSADTLHVNIQSFRHALRGRNSFRIVGVSSFTNGTMNEMERNETVWYSKDTTEIYSNTTPLVKGSAVFTGRIPHIGSTGELQFPNAVTEVTAIWGLSTLTHSNVQQDIPIKIPAMSIVTATLVVNSTTYEVPFSYRQIDEFQFGRTEAQSLNDGVYMTKSDYGAEFRYDIRPFTSEAVLDENTYTDLQLLKQQGKGINAVDEGIEAKASDEVNQE